MATPVDHKNISARLYTQISKLLDDLDKPVKKGQEPISFRERLAALTAIGRLQMVFLNLRKEGNEDGRDTGSAVRKYAGAFKNAGRGRKAAAGQRASEPEPDGDDDPFAGIGDDDDAA